MSIKKRTTFVSSFLTFIGSKCFLLIAISLAFLVRVLNLHRFLGFYFDQGRDALIIWNFLKDGKFFLIGPTIGPTMGVGDVPRGPWYLWLLIPFYWLGKGNPVFPAWFLSFSVVSAILILYFLCLKIGGKYLAFLSLIISGFSFSLILSSHWLSNPTLMYLLSVLFLWSLFGIIEKKEKYFWLSGFLSGMSMHFGGAADMFYPLIAFLIAFIWSRKILNFKNILFFWAFYVFTFLPQVIFDIRHNGVIRKGLMQFLSSSRSFDLSFWEVLSSRIYLYLDTFSEVVWGEKSLLFILFFVLLLLFVLFEFREIKKNKYFLTVLMSIAVPLLGMLFLRGDKGVIYGYYFTGFYLYFVIFFSFLLLQLSKFKRGYLIIVLFILIFLGRNFYLLSRYFIYDFRKYNPITLEDQLKAIDWVYQDAKGRDFNVDIYVPPVIPYAYDYLFKWYGFQKYGFLPKEDQVELLYTLSEKDSAHPERLEKWMARQDKIGRIEKEFCVFDIKVERRLRISYAE